MQKEEIKNGLERFGKVWKESRATMETIETEKNGSKRFGKVW
jgi:hypothetical protein